MSSFVKIIIAVLVVAGVGFFGYNYLSRTDTTSDTLLQQTSTNNTSSMGAEVLTALNQLRTLKLDDSVFKDKTFMSLQDFSKPLDAEPIGRTNPFSPIGVENGPVKLAPLEQATSTLKATTTKATTTKATSAN